MQHSISAAVFDIRYNDSHQVILLEKYPYLLTPKNQRGLVLICDDGLVRMAG